MVKHSVALLLAMSGLLACGGAEDGGPTDPEERPPSVIRQIVPALTDSAIDVSSDPHVAVNPSPVITPAGKLFVFLPGTGGIPTRQQLILATAAAHGVHAIGLAYPNDSAVGVLCADDVDPDCFWDVRREVITGVNTSTRVHVTPANAIVNRLERLLSYLQAQYPSEGWGRFLVDGRIDWQQVTVAGHSQGGGHAGVLAKLVSLHRVVYFSSPADWRQVANTPATWLSRPNVTPASRHYAFIHEQDQLVPQWQARANWIAIGLDTFGPVTNIDGMTPPYGDTHRVTTRAVPRLEGAEHGATVVDAATPRSPSGTPLFEPVWRYLAFPE
jgi:hypothetical protein